MASLDKKNKNLEITNRSIIAPVDKSKEYEEELKENKETISKIFIECLKKSCSETTAHAIPNIGK